MERLGLNMGFRLLDRAELSKNSQPMANSWLHQSREPIEKHSAGVKEAAEKSKFAEEPSRRG
jgi:hypothetical protein